MRHTDDRDVLDAGIAAEDVLDLARVNVLAAADDHVALAVDQVDETMLVAARHVADAAIAIAAQRLRRFNWVVEITVERVRRGRKELANLAVGHFIALRVQYLYGPRAGPLASDRAQMIDLIVRAQQRHPTRFARAVKLEELRVGEVFEDRELGVLARRRR